MAKDSTCRVEVFLPLMGGINLVKNTCNKMGARMDYKMDSFIYFDLLNLIVYSFSVEQKYKIVIADNMFVITSFMIILLTYGEISAASKNPMKFRFNCFISDDRMNSSFTNLSTNDFQWFLNGRLLNGALSKNSSIKFYNSNSILELGIWENSSIYLGDFECHNAVQGFYQFQLKG